MERNAVLSVSDKAGLEVTSEFLISQGYRLFCTSGTKSYLEGKKVKCSSIESLTSTPEILGGRVKTLSFQLLAGILAKERDDKEIKKLGYRPIDLVYVEPYDFRGRFLAGEKDLTEFIDIGGITLLRSAAKNFSRVIAVVGKRNMERVVAEMRDGEVTLELRRSLASEVFRFTSLYDYVISEWFDGKGENFTVGGSNLLELRYGENPHQSAKIYATFPPFFEMLKEGKEISFNNIMDAWSGWDLVLRLGKNSCAVVKHGSPCGAAVGPDPLGRAYESDPVSAYGGIIALNGKIGESEAEYLKGKYVEVVIASDFSRRALDLLSKRRNLRILRGNEDCYRIPEIRTAGNVILVQEWNRRSTLNLQVRSGELSREVEEDIRFGWEVVKSVKSNAIILVGNGQLLSSCGGQPNRIDAVKIAIERAKSSNRIHEKAVLISDGFFPFADSIETIWSNGIRNVAAPTGSLRDEEVISAARKYGINFVDVGERGFRH
ncbi:MAG: bifunctional phosphoribosylaminoimidazolecarboxamide formyltransferase/IMP cyclohydrolase [Thermoplasmata archaeon]